MQRVENGETFVNVENMWKRPIALFTVLFTIFVWNQIVLLTMDNFLIINMKYSEAGPIFGVYYISLTFFIIVSSNLLKGEKKVYVLVWNILAIITSIIIVLFGVNGIETKISYSFLAGASVGTGLPLCLAYFADNMPIEKRGRAGAIVFFLISLMYVALAIMVSALNVQNFALFSFFWTLLSLIAFLVLKVEKKAGEKKISWKLVISNKQFLFYFVPWVMFCFIDAFEAPILEKFVVENFGNSFLDLILLIETSVTAIGILIAGFLVDYYGRRRIVLYGFIILGVAYAWVGITPWNAFSWYFYALIYGLALGVFIVTFVFTVWGDLSPAGDREKYYALGILPFFVVVYIQKVISPYLLEIPISAAFSLAAFFLFLAVWPLFNAIETLPEKKIRERELKKYIEKAKKVKEKYG